MRAPLRSVATLGLLVPALIAAAALKSQLTLQPDSRLWVDGTSTVRSFSCKASTFDAIVSTTQDAAVRAVLGGEKAVDQVTVTVPAARLDCGNGKMNEHMRKALEATENPQITFRMQSYELATAGAGMAGTLRGELTLGGVTRPIVVEAMAADGGEGTLLVTGKHVVKMTDFGLKPPSLMMGTMKVGDAVTVGFELRLRN